MFYASGHAEHSGQGRSSPDKIGARLPRWSNAKVGDPMGWPN